MRECLDAVAYKKVERVMAALKRNNMNAYFVENEKEALEKVKTFLSYEYKIGVGGSVTLSEIGLIDELRSGKYEFIDTLNPTLSNNERHKLYRECFFSDVYFCSSNAITEDGKLYNVDGRSNRVAAMLYGPNKVVFVVGTNKIVSTLDDAIKRNKEISAPANALRLNKKTPCAKTLVCKDCDSPERICRNFIVMGPQFDKERVHVIIVNKSLGY
ncbi:MAG TPA: lactate utilization protein [Firmicutes bacterium]|nr:lactate utilization protein [Bacillota bacterium]